MTSLGDNVKMLHGTMARYSHAKRFNERWLADPTFRTLLFQDPDRAIADYAISVDPEEMRGITAGDTARAGSIAHGIYSISAMKSVVMDRWYGPEATASHGQIAAWRERHQARMRLELGPFAVKSSVQAAWNAELTLGCSGGCWFCNMAAPELSGVARSDARSLEEWREIVRALKCRLGPATRTGFLDGATDPFDHPEYESFCRIVRDEAGFFPPTSTAMAMRDPDRSRRFFAEARDAGCWSVRLTIRDQQEFDAIHSTFSSDELAHVQLNTLTPQSNFVYSLAGRFRERFLDDPDFAARERRKLRFAPWYTMSKDYRDDDEYPLDANTGVLGFSINMVERVVSLVTPRPSSDVFPFGIETLDRIPFSDAIEFGNALNRLIERWMPERILPDDRLALLPGLLWEPISGGVRVHGRFRQHVDFTDPHHEHRIRDIAGRLEDETTLADITRSQNTDPEWVTAIIQEFFRAGVLREVRRT